MSLRIFNLPAELLERIYVESEPQDFVALSSCCRRFYDILHKSSNQFVWRSHFLRHFDDPRRCISRLGEPVARDARSFDWRGELLKRIRLDTVLTAPSLCRPEEVTDTLRTLILMIIETPPASPIFRESELSMNLSWLHEKEPGFPGVALAGFIDHLQERELSQNEKRLLHQVNSLNGMTVADLSFDDIRSFRSITNRCTDEDRSNYNRRGPYPPMGPYQLVTSESEVDDEAYLKVDWKYIHAAVNVFASHFTITEEDEEYISLFNLPQCQAQFPKRPSSCSHDWAGIERNWSLYLTFLMVDGIDEEPEGESTWEIRRVDALLKVENVIPNPMFPSRPTIFFADDADVHTMKGSVSMTAEQEVRWKLAYTFEELEDGMTLRFDGVQVGSVGSNFGVIGTYWNTLRPYHSIMGPACLLKLRE
ncbi:hypothetical protein SCHPADRAFT_943244 [Schizopora paradoxa]|uniref:F-box domain-containing protein n=1 Tax=Schizopora paradoxa TaxID=27342 RepID=A0A0H2RYY8_9AGAM|nr:hypothetical protein SCHPADRAFT_943244 [Schizopora paradoxa]